MDPRIRIHSKMAWIRNTDFGPIGPLTYTVLSIETVCTVARMADLPELRIVVQLVQIRLKLGQNVADQRRVFCSSSLHELGHAGHGQLIPRNVTRREGAQATQYLVAQLSVARFDVEEGLVQCVADDAHLCVGQLRQNLRSETRVTKGCSIMSYHSLKKRHFM
jgi:hypothetical protein